MELVHKYRPKKFKDVVGQSDASKTLLRMVQKNKVPQVILFSGPPGTGKTTFSRILKEKLHVHDRDFIMVNAAQERGIDMVRDIENRKDAATFSGGPRMWILDEAHQLTKDAQNGLLLVLEEPPKKVYFILCTTEPTKLIKTVRTRCTEIKVGPVSTDAMKELLQNISKKEKMTVTDECFDKIVEVADGCARQAVKILDKILPIEKEEDRIEAILNSDNEKVGIDLARVLLNERSQWKDAAALLKKIEDDPEGVRQIILGYCRAIILNGGGPKLKRCLHIMDCFQEPTYSAPKALLAFYTANVYFA
jgi:DNA polymerase-3 subunit gamma/tau